MSKKFKQDETEIIGLSLKEYRQSRRLTLREVSDLSKVHVSQISRIENGIFKFGSKNFDIICKFYGDEFAKYHQRKDIVAIRASKIAARSPKHLEIMLKILDLLEDTETLRS